MKNNLFTSTEQLTSSTMLLVFCSRVFSYLYIRLSLSAIQIHPFQTCLVVSCTLHYDRTANRRMFAISAEQQPAYCISDPYGWRQYLCTRCLCNFTFSFLSHWSSKSLVVCFAIHIYRECRLPNFLQLCRVHPLLWPLLKSFKWSVWSLHLQCWRDREYSVLTSSMFWPGSNWSTNGALEGTIIQVSCFIGQCTS